MAMSLKSIVTVLVLSFAGAAIGADHCIPTKMTLGTDTYFVSGVLKKQDAGVTIKLVHSVEFAATSQEALAVFATKAAAEYPGYVMIDALVTQTQTESKASCRFPPGVSI